MTTDTLFEAIFHLFYNTNFMPLSIICKGYYVNPECHSSRLYNISNATLKILLKNAPHSQVEINTLTNDLGAQCENGSNIFRVIGPFWSYIFIIFTFINCFHMLLFSPAMLLLLLLLLLVSVTFVNMYFAPTIRCHFHTCTVIICIHIISWTVYFCDSELQSKGSILSCKLSASHRWHILSVL